jgi:hypothetical protein
MGQSRRVDQDLIGEPAYARPEHLDEAFVAA